MPSWTVAGRFGIARTTGTPGAIRPSIAEVGIAAATESTVCSGVSRPPISPSRASKSCGLTAITTSAAPATASAFDVVASTPWRSASSVARCSSRTVTTSSEGSRQPPLRRPRRSDSPIVPAPRIATRRGSATRESLGGGALRDRHETEPVGREQVDAREARPFAVGLEELRRFPRLDPAAAHGGAELDEAEVAGDPALEAAEPFEADHAYRPGAEPALPLEPVGGRRGRQ